MEHKILKCWRIRVEIRRIGGRKKINQRLPIGLRLGIVEAHCMIPLTRKHLKNYSILPYIREHSRCRIYLIATFDSRTNFEQKNFEIIAVFNMFSGWNRRNQARDFMLLMIHPVQSKLANPSLPLQTKPDALSPLRKPSYLPTATNFQKCPLPLPLWFVRKRSGTQRKRRRGKNQTAENISFLP